MWSTVDDVYRIIEFLTFIIFVFDLNIKNLGLYLARELNLAHGPYFGKKWSTRFFKLLLVLKYLETRWWF